MAYPTRLSTNPIKKKPKTPAPIALIVVVNLMPLARISFPEKITKKEDNNVHTVFIDNTEPWFSPCAFANIGTITFSPADAVAAYST
jgi:hypothetical protein